MLAAGSGPGVAMQTLLTVSARPTGSGLELSAGVTAQPTMGRFRSFQVPDTDYAPVHLETDGRRWIERDGPTFLFDDLGTQGGLLWFFPDLPELGTEGATVRWEIHAPDGAAVLSTEAARGHHAGLGGTRPTAARPDVNANANADANANAGTDPVPQVRFERWTVERGTRIAELSMLATADGTASVDTPMGEGMKIHAQATFHGTYAVLPSGHLLRAEIVKDGSSELTTTIQGKPDVQNHVQHTTRRLHLVQACDGPVEASLVKPLTREERAIEAWGEAWLAFTKGQEAGLLSALDPALRQKYGDPQIVAALKKYRSLRGERALPPPVMLQDEDVSADAASVRLVTHGTTPDPTTKNTVTPVDVDVTLRDEGGHFVVTALRGNLTLENSELFELTAQRMVVQPGWPSK
jgi:hypothetical protein